MYNYKSSPVITNCTFSGNSTENEGGGINSYWVINNSANKVNLTNCIFWYNNDNGGMDESAQIYTRNGTSAVNYSCVQNWSGALGGTGNIGTDPCFADSNNGDYHLKSEAGRWDHSTESWVTDANTSSCIDAGDPNSDWTAELWPHGKCINMGAFGGTAQASMSPSSVGNIADLNNDDLVDYTDLMLLTGKWLREDILLREDLDRDGLTNCIDYAIFANKWLWEE